MEKLTYKQAYDKIIEAYFKDEIKPFDTGFCFCGTLSPDYRWPEVGFSATIYPYSEKEYILMEKALLHKFPGIHHIQIGHVTGDTEGVVSTPLFEDYLFNGMCAALDALKEIHRSRGENVDEELTPFTKRNISKQLVNQ